MALGSTINNTCHDLPETKPSHGALATSNLKYVCAFSLKYDARVDWHFCLILLTPFVTLTI